MATTAARQALPVDQAESEIIAGLCAASPSISPKYLYDVLGSHLFEAITVLPEYYPTRTESAILSRCLNEIALDIGPGCSLIDLGAGSCQKARRLIESLAPANYIAVDISNDYLHQTLATLQREHPETAMGFVNADISSPISLPNTIFGERRLFAYLGSSIGNFAAEAAFSILKHIREACGDGGALLIGVDLVKPAEILHAAYNDALGITAAFNLNILNHVNRLIGSDFNVGDWEHQAFFNMSCSRIEMHLAARRDVTVRWPTGERIFLERARIHTENSYKYRQLDFETLLKQAGFDGIASWTDERSWFCVFLAKVHQ